MGRKVHPIGFRLKVVKEWEGRWFATGSVYREQLGQDIAIRKSILEGRRRAAIARVEIERYPNKVHVTIFSGKPERNLTLSESYHPPSFEYRVPSFITPGLN